MSADGLYVSYTKQQVEDTPDTDSDHISRERERRLYEHYELGKVGVSAEDELTVIRSEERVSVGTEAAETGRVRLRKWVETEPVETQVKAHRESARIEYEPVGLPVSGVELGEQEIDIPLLVQEPMLEKQVVTGDERTSIPRPPDEQVVYRAQDERDVAGASRTGFDVSATIGGALAALGTLLLLSSLLGAILGAIGYQTGVEGQELSVGGLIAGLVALLLALLTGLLALGLMLLGGWLGGRGRQDPEAPSLHRAG